MISEKIRNELENYNSLLGCIKYENNYNFYLMPIAWWILDYKSYDPIGSKKNNPAFRNNIYTVNNNQIQLFLDTIYNDQISLDDLKSIIFKYRNNEYDNYDELLFFIDFDKYVYITNFSEIEVEKYLPEKWTGKSDDPLKYLPDDLSCLWEKRIK